jgi:hypothetical protein
MKLMGKEDGAGTYNIRMHPVQEQVLFFNEEQEEEP